MTLQSSGAISMQDLVGEFGGSGEARLEEYYRDINNQGGAVPNHSGTANIPSSGTISLQDFYGATATNPIDNNFAISGASGTRGVAFGSGVNYGWAVASGSGGFFGQSYGASGSPVDTSANLGNNTTKRMLTGAVGFSETGQGKNAVTIYGIELMFSSVYADANHNTTSGTTGFPVQSNTTISSELQGNKLKIAGTQYAVFPSLANSAVNGISYNTATGATGASTGFSMINGYDSHRVRIAGTHSSSGSTTITGSLMSVFLGTNVSIQIVP